MPVRGFWSKTWFPGAAMCALIMAPGLAMAATDREVGVTAVVNTKAEGTPPSQDRRVLATGTKMYFEEKVITNATGRAQLLFADGSSMTIGPNSDLVIDTFIYNPDTKVGDMTVRLTKGFVRFVGGRISKRKAVKFKTPIGSIGIRGGIALVEMQPAQGLVVDFLFGEEVTVEVDGNVQTTTTPGTFMTVGASGQSVSAPERRQASDLNQRLKSFENQGNGSDQAQADSGQTGGQDSNSGGGSQQPQSQQSTNSQTTDGTGGDGSSNSNDNNDASAPGSGTADGPATASPEDGQGQSGLADAGASSSGATSGGDQLAQIDIGVSSLSDDTAGGLGGDAVPGTSTASGASEGSTATFVASDDTLIAIALNQGVDTPQPRPEENQAVAEPTATPTSVDPDPTPEPTVDSTPTPAPTSTVVTTTTPEPDPEPEPETTQTPTPTAFSRSFNGFALRGGTSFATLGADTTITTATLANRQFSTVTVSGSDDTVGGRFTASSTAGAYGIFYPAPTGSSPTNLSACPTALDCSVQIAGVTPSTTTGPIDHGADPNFVTYALNVDSEKALLVIGKEFTGSTPTTGATRYSIKPDSFLATDLPFVRSSDSGFTNANNDTDAYAKWSTTASAVPFMASRFQLDQTNGKSSLGVIMGNINISSSPFVNAIGIAQVDQTGTATPTLFKGGAYSTDTASGRDFFGASDPDYFVLNSVADSDTGGSNAGVQDLAGSTPYYPVIVVGTAGSHTVNASNTQLANVTLTGYYGGAGSLATTPGAYVATTAADTSFLSISTSTDQPSVTINVTVDGGSNVIQADDSGGTGAYIDDGHFATELDTGSTTGGGAEATAKAGYLVTGGNNAAGFDLCSTCEFLTWGFWGHVQSANQVAFHMASWVAGVATNFGTLGALTASGTYTGNVIGSIIDTGATQVKTGTFSLGVSLAGASSTATLNSFSFNGDSFTTTATGFDATSQYFTLTDTNGGRTLDMRGAFFGTDGANIPPEVGGDFKINGTGYTAAGAFAGKK